MMFFVLFFHVVFALQCAYLPDCFLTESSPDVLLSKGFVGEDVYDYSPQKSVGVDERVVLQSTEGDGVLEEDVSDYLPQKSVGVDERVVLQSTEGEGVLEEGVYDYLPQKSVDVDERVVLQSKGEFAVGEGLYNARRKDILQKWGQRKEEWFPLPTLLRVVDLQTNNGGMFARRQEFLGYALEGVPVMYNKETQAFMLLGHEKDIPIPQDGQNLMTMVCDFIRQYKKGITVEELAYYAQEMGYLRGGFYKTTASKKALYTSLEKYKRFLVLLEIVGMDVFTKEMEKDAARQFYFWQKEKDAEVLYSADFYNRDGVSSIQEKDVDLVRELQAFIKEPEYAVLQNHLAQSCEKKATEISHDEYIKQLCLTKRTLDELLFACKSRGMHLQLDFWPAVGRLARNIHSGCLRYDLKDNVFFWHAERCVPPKKPSDCVVDAFTIQLSHPQLSTYLICQVLQQDGAVWMTMANLRVLLRALTILGLRPMTRDGENLDVQRKLANTMVQGYIEEKVDMQVYVRQENKISAPDVRACVRICTWVQKGQMKALWTLYKKQLISKALCDSHAEAPPLKRIKLLFQDQSPEVIIKEHMPAIYQFLKSTCVWA